MSIRNCMTLGELPRQNEIIEDSQVERDYTEFD